MAIAAWCENEPRRINELLIADIALHRMLLEVHRGAQRLEVDVDHAVGFRQQTRHFRRRLLPQPGKSGEQRDDDGGDEECGAGTSAHDGRGGADRIAAH
jgi:hypothetical protein